MKNITVAISDEGYRQARIWAAERNVSLSASSPTFLKPFPIRRVRPAASRAPTNPPNPSSPPPSHLVTLSPRNLLFRRLVTS